MNNYPSPCETCAKKRCPRECLPWRVRYMHRQNQINAYARQNGIVPGAPEYTAGKNPCDCCARSENCSAICRARAKYWDERMKLVRKGFGL